MPKRALLATGLHIATGDVLFLSPGVLSYKIYLLLSEFSLLSRFWRAF